jgi:hypothetical protein
VANAAGLGRRGVHGRLRRYDKDRREPRDTEQDHRRAESRARTRLRPSRTRLRGIGDTGWEIHVDGAPIGALKTGTFVYRDLPAGRRQLSFAPPGHLARASHYELAAVPGRTYYFRLEMNDKGKMINAGAALGGLSGYFLASAIADGSDERGVYDFIPMEDAAARTAMAELRLAE